MTDEEKAKAEQEKEANIASLKRQHGRIGVVEFDDGRYVVLRRPKRAEFDSYYDQGGAGGAATCPQSTRRQLITDTLVYPSKDELEKILNDYPIALGQQLLSAALALAGAGKAKARIVD